MTQEKTTKWPTKDKKETAKKKFWWGISPIKLCMRLIWAIVIILFTIFFFWRSNFKLPEIINQLITIRHLSNVPFIEAFAILCFSMAVAFSKASNCSSWLFNFSSILMYPAVYRSRQKTENKMPGLTEKPWFFDLFFCASEQSIVRTSVLKHRLRIAGINILAAVKIYIANLMLFLYIRFILSRLSIGMKWLTVIQLLIEPF